jgi:membrane protein implicated in regulation of membrane protease activity
MSRDLLVYALWQLPGQIAAVVVAWLLVTWGWLSAPWAVLLVLGWVAKDYALYPLLRHAFRRAESAPGSLVGVRGVVQTALAPQGQVQLGGELWRAEPLTPGTILPAGTPVVVRAVRGLTVLVDAGD